MLLPVCSAAQRPPVWTLSPELRIGSESEAGAALSRIPGLAVGPDGRIYVLQPLAHSIWVFDAAGRRVQTLGRRGYGPGEFQNPVAIGWRRDTLWVLDGNEDRVTLFQSNRAHSTISVAPAWYPVGLMDDGSILAKQNVLDQDIGTGKVTSLRYAWLTRQGLLRGDFARLDVRHAGMFVRNPAPGHELPNTLRRQPFSDAALLAVSSDGRTIVVVDRVAERGRSGTFIVRNYDARGRRRWVSRISYSPRPLTRRVVDDSIALHARAIASIPDFGATEAVAAGWIRRIIYAPPNLPPITSVVAGRDGTTWLRRESGTAWLVLDPRGRPLATVRAPAGLRIVEADRSQVWGVVMDAMNVPYVVRYRVAG